VNDAYCRYFAMRREDLIGHKFMPLIPEENHELFARHLASFCPEKSVAVIEHRVVQADGSLRWQQWTDRAMFDEGGTIVEFQSVGRDVTARKEAEEALHRAHEQLEERVRERTAELSRANAILAGEIAQRERAQELLRTSEEKFRNLIEHLQDVVWEVDANLVFTYVSRNVRDVLGYDPEEVVGTPAFKYVSADDMMMKLAGLFAKSLDSLEPFRFIEIGMTHKDGRQVMLESSGSPIIASDGQIAGFRGVSRDVTERKQMQEALRQSEERYRKIAETANEGIWTIGLDWKTVFVNGKMAEMLGCSLEEMKNRLLFDFVDDEGKAFALESRERRKQGISEQYEMRLRRKDGSVLWAIAGVTPIFDQDGHFAGTLGLVTDITGRKQAEARIEHLNAVLRAVRSVDQLVTQEKSQPTLVQKACEALIASRSYDNARIVLVDQEGNPRELAEAAAPHSDLPDRPKGTVLPCVRQALQQPDVLIVEKDEAFCAECTCRCAQWRRPRACARLESHGRAYGVLEVSMPAGHLPDAEERALLAEIAGDIAFALHGLELAEERQLAEERYRHMFENTSDAVAVYRATDDGEDFIIIDLNSNAERLEKIRRAKVIGRRVTDVFPGIKAFGLFDVLQRVWRTGTPEHHSPQFYEDRRIKGWRENFVYKLASGEVVAIYEDVTRNQQTREEKEATIQLLSLINLAGSSKDLVSTLAQFLMNWSGCDGVGIRLRDGDDFPYSGTSGLPGEFVQLERSLCAVDEQGQFRRGENGAIALECLCGRVVLGLVDPSKPFYTAHGSFWTNNLSRLLAKVSETEWGTHLRGRCPAAGYESLALVPLRCGQEIIGLVQFNGRRKGCFSLQRISLLERLAHSVAIAIEQRRAKEALLVHQQQLQSLASELALAEERERRRIATTLHDNIGQNLALTRMRLGELRKKAAGGPLAEQVEKVLELTEQIIKQTRLLTAQLSPPILYELGFEAAVEWLGEQFQNEHGIACTVEDDKLPKPLDDDIRVVLFQAVRELLMNVAKHARAHGARVSMRRRDHYLHVTVEDDGVGFDASKADARRRTTTGFGLFSIRERLEHLGGQVSIEPLPHRGTRVSLIAPLREAQK